MTEEEAKTKWCPFARNGGEAGCNRLQSTECLGSACMAWRWSEEFADADTEGYCGLAGKP